MSSAWLDGHGGRRLPVGWLVVAVMVGSLIGACTEGGGGRGRSGSDGGNNPGEDASTDGCPSGRMECDGRCVNTDIDAQNCGGCGMVCSSGACQDGACVDNECSPECSSGERCCGTSCINREAPEGQVEARTDPSFDNCGACGVPCDGERATRCATPPGGGPVQCLCGNFERCAPGSTCTNDSGSWRCVNNQTNPESCGESGERCAEGESCVSGQCVCGSTGASCGEGESCCSGSCIDTTSDGSNCGGCGVECGGSNPSCIDSQCRCSATETCSEPSMSSLGELCCGGSCVAQNNDNCSSCGTMCNVEDDEECITSSGGIIPGMGGGDDVRTCCGRSLGPLGGVCIDGLPGGGGGDGGFGLPGGDGGFGFP